MYPRSEVLLVVDPGLPHVRIRHNAASLASPFSFSRGFFQAGLPILNVEGGHLHSRAVGFCAEAAEDDNEAASHARPTFAVRVDCAVYLACLVEVHQGYGSSKTESS